MWKEYKTDEQIRITSMYSLFEASYESGYSFRGEVHNFWECVYVKKGSICVSADGRVYNLAENEMIFHKPMELHKFYVNSGGGAELFIFSFSAEGGAQDFFKNKVFRLNKAQKNIVYGLLDYLHKKEAEFEPPQSMRPAEKYIFPFEKSGIYAQMVTSYIIQLMLSLYNTEPVSYFSDNPEAVVFQNAVRLMKNNICLSLSIAEIAKHCNISPTGLKRVFYKFSDMSVHKYFVRLKVKTASELLKSGYTVTETAEKTGFGSQAYFSAVFKRELGICASEFIKSVT